MNDTSHSRKKLLLINPANRARAGLSLNSGSRFPPMGLGIIAALTPSDWSIQLVDENWESFQYEPADLVGISAFTATVHRAYGIADVYRKKNVSLLSSEVSTHQCVPRRHWSSQIQWLLERLNPFGMKFSGISIVVL